MSSYSLVLVVLIVLILVCMMGIYFWTQRKKNLYDPYDEMEGTDFEYYCAELLRKRGFLDVTVTKASGDFGIDILAEKEGVTYGIQCKCYQEPVGVKAVQEVYAGRDYYDCMVGVVMTNQYFTEPAVAAAKKLKIMLWDRDYIEEETPV